MSDDKRKPGKRKPGNRKPGKNKPDKSPGEKVGKPEESSTKRVTLKAVAEYLKLSPATISVVLNRSPVADSIPTETKERVFEAARVLRYRPNFLARSLRGKRTYSVGVLVPEISEGYAAGIMSGVETHLIQEGYFYLMASHQSSTSLVEEYLNRLEDRSVEGFLLVAAQITRAPVLPTVAVAGHKQLDGVTNVVIDHHQAGRLALSHLADLGHRKIAFFKGHSYSADTEDRWQSIVQAADDLGLDLDPELTLQLAGHPSGAVFSAEEGYREGEEFGQKLLATGRQFTALFAFNDMSAIGAMRAFITAGLSVPGDISVVGFDDIQSAAFHNPSLTTVRQPLKEMGEIASRILVRRLAGDTSYSAFETVEPTLVVRDSTGPPVKGGWSIQPSIHAVP